MEGAIDYLDGAFDRLGTLAQRLGITLTEASPDRVVGVMPVEGNTQPYGLLHGGASCVLAETLLPAGSGRPDRTRLTCGLTLSDVTEVPPEALDDAAAVLHSALAGDSDAVAGAFDSVVDRSGVEGAYDVAWCLAATMVGDGVARGRWTLEFPGIDQAGYDTRWVARFVSAYVNSDASTGEALFGAALADGQLPDCLLTLAGSAVATLRRRAT